jgi:hypothetical protein
VVVTRAVEAPFQVRVWLRFPTPFVHAQLVKSIVVFARRSSLSTAFPQSALS